MLDKNHHVHGRAHRYLPLSQDDERDISHIILDSEYAPGRRGADTTQIGTKVGFSVMSRVRTIALNKKCIYIYIAGARERRRY